MVSELAKEDIERLQGEGYEVPVEFIIRLNAIGLKIKYHPECELATLPRIVILEDHVLRQPSVGQEMLIDDVVRMFNEDRDTSVVISAYIICHQDFDIAQVEKPKKFINDVRKWLVKEFKKTTIEQLACAIEYLKYGYDPSSGEHPVYLTDDKDDEEWDAIGGDRSWVLSRYLESAAVGIPTASALRATSPQLAAMIERAYISRGCELKDREKQLTKDYYMTLESLRKLLDQMKEEKNNG